MTTADQTELVSLESHETSIFHLYTPFSRNMILGIAAFLALLTPFTDTVYLPALKALAEDFDATDSMAALTVSIYLAAVGIGQILWGPLSDKFGRVYIILIALVFYEGITIGCIFSPTIEAFLILRSFQGFIVGCTIIIAQATIADVFPPKERGEATGAFLGPMLIGPVIAPIIGGFLSQAFGWRATFILLACLGAPGVMITLLAFPETHHHFVSKSIEETNISKSGKFRSLDRDVTQTTDVVPSSITPDKKIDYSTVSVEENEELESNVAIDEIAKESTTTLFTESTKSKNSVSSKLKNEDQLSTIFQQMTYDPDQAAFVSSIKASPNHLITITEREYIPKPTFTMPWNTLYLCFDPEVAFFLYEQSISFAIMFSSMTLLPVFLAESPYELNESVVGITFLAVGIGMLVGAVHGGMLSDYSAVKFPSAVEGRLLYTQTLIPMMSLGSMGFAYALQYGAHLGWVLASQFILGYAQSAIMSGVMSYLTAVKPASAAAAGAVSMFLCFAFSAVCTAVGVLATETVELSGFFWILNGIMICDFLFAVFKIMSAFKGKSPPVDSSIQLEMSSQA